MYLLGVSRGFYGGWRIVARHCPWRVASWVMVRRRAPRFASEVCMADRPSAERILPGRRSVALSRCGAMQNRRRVQRFEARL
jgi:hypothetical protein